LEVESVRSGSLRDWNAFGSLALKLVDGKVVGFFDVLVRLCLTHAFRGEAKHDFRF
jgi:hypothetical protein